MSKALRIVAMIIDVGAPLVAVLLQFPLFVQRSSEATISGISLVFVLLCAIPLRNRIKEFMKSPSIPVLWAFMFLVSLAVSEIVQEVIVITFVGMVANLIGALLNLIAKAVERKKDNG